MFVAGIIVWQNALKYPVSIIFLSNALLKF